MNRIARSLTAAVLGALPLCMAPLTHADARNPTECHIRVPPGAGGIGKRQLDRDVAEVMGWQGAAWLTREERTDLLVTALWMTPDMLVSNIGASAGYLANRIAQAEPYIKCTRGLRNPHEPILLATIHHRRHA